MPGGMPEPLQAPESATCQSRLIHAGYSSTPLPNEHNEAGLGSSLQKPGTTTPVASEAVVLPVQPLPPLDGSLLATCQELGLLGQGAYGVVHRVLVTPAGSEPAFEAARKQMPTGSPEARTLFAAEVDALKAGLGCPYVVQLLDVRTTATHHELLMELLQGGTLADELASKRSVRLPEARVRAVALDTLRGLAHLHARQVCSRDVKITNIMLRKEGGQAVLIDLGLACKANKAGRLAPGCGGVGTLGQLAPEMKPGCPTRAGSRTDKAGRIQKAMRLPPPTVKCDVFCLGQTLATCAARGDLGRLPSAPLRQFLEQLMAEHPDERLSAAEALRHPYLAAAQ